VSSSPGTAAALAAVFRFHAGVGARLALRAAVPAFAAAFGAATLLGTDFLGSLTDTFYGSGSGLPSWLVVSGLALGLASTAAPRVCRGLPAGWLRHLPASGATHRRGATLATALAQAPLLVALAVLACGAALRSGRNALPALAGLPLLALAAAQLAVPARHRLAVLPFSGAAALASASARPAAIAVAVVLAAISELVAGPLATPHRSRRRSRPRPAPAARFLPARIAWRAVRSRLAAAYLLGLLPLGAGALFLANNQNSQTGGDLSPAGAALASRLAAGTAVALLLAALPGRGRAPFPGAPAGGPSSTPSGSAPMPRPCS
jgi:hypothetical protein